MKHLVPYETAKQLSELGYNEEPVTEGMYNTGGTLILMKGKTSQQYVTAPLWQQVGQWLWDKHEITIKKYHTSDGAENNEFYCQIIKYTRKTKLLINDTEFNTSPILAEQEGVIVAVAYLYKQSKK